MSLVGHTHIADNGSASAIILRPSKGTGGGKGGGRGRKGGLST